MVRRMIRNPPCCFKRAPVMTSEIQNVGLTPEQAAFVELSNRMESIFMPHAKKQRDDAHKRQKRPGKAGEQIFRCAHYTSAEAALSIIKTKRIWMRNTTCMADYREVQHGFAIFDEF